MGTYLLVSGDAGYTDAWGDSWPANVTVSRIYWDGVTPYTPDDGLTLIEDDGREVYQRPNLVPVPESVEKWQLQIILNSKPATGIFPGNTTLLDDANSLATAKGGNTLIAWNGATVVKRTSPTIAEMASIFRLNDAEVDQIFISAAHVIL